MRVLEKLTGAGDVHATNAVARKIDRLTQTPPPPGVQIEATSNGIILSGKRLRRRMLTDPGLRNFGR